MRLEHSKLDFITGNVNTEFGYRPEDIVDIFSITDQDSSTLRRHRIISTNGGVAGIPDSTYDLAPNETEFLNKTDNSWYRKNGLLGFIDGSWTPTGGTGALYTYQALISQLGTSAPTDTVLGTSGIGTLTWARSSTGTHTATSATAVFTANKTFPQILNFPVAQVDTEFKADCVVTSTTILTFTVRDSGGNFVDGFSNMSFKVEVFA